MKIIVIILNWNGREDTLRCLSSLRSQSVAHSVVVVDNGSTDDSVSAITHAFSQVELIETGANLGYAEGNNVGLRHALQASPDAILILNNDTIVSSELLSAFLRRDRPIQGGALHRMSNPELLDHLGGMWNATTARFDPVALNAPAEEWTQPMDLDYVCGCALFVRAEVFRSVGHFDRRFFLLWEECDWCYRAAYKGYRSSFCPEARIQHRVSASFSGGVQHTTYYWWRNRLLWMELHCNAKERQKLMRMLMPQIFQTFRKYVRRTMKHWFVQKSPETTHQLREFRAMLAGVRDYYLRRFGAGPQWLMDHTSGSASRISFRDAAAPISTSTVE